MLTQDELFQIGGLVLLLVPGGYGVGYFIGDLLAYIIRGRFEEADWSRVGGLIGGCTGLSGSVGVFLAMLSS